MDIITEFSDYTIQSIEYFIKAIEDGIQKRDLPGLTLINKDQSVLEKINVSKEHPLVVEMKSVVENRNANAMRSSILPAISVTPGNMDEEAVTFGETPETKKVDGTWIDELKQLLSKNTKEIQQEVGLITLKQIETIIAAYKRTNGRILCQTNLWGWNEEINISCWSDSADLDILMGTLIDSILAKTKVGNMGDNSPVKKMKYRPTKGLTNFNFGRVLFGTEFSVNFFNSYKYYTIFKDDLISGHDLTGQYKTPGSN